MARQDLVGLLTGVQSTQQPISATNPQDWRMQFGQRQSEKMNQRLRGLTGRMSTQEALGAGLSQLDLSTPEGLRTVAKLQQSTGNLAGAAQTAARIQAMKQAELAEKRAVEADRRAERGLELREEQAAMQKAATERQLDLEQTQLAQQGVSRELLYERAMKMGRPELANMIRAGNISLDKATAMVFPSSSAAVKPPTKDEEDAFNVVLESEGFKDIIKDLEETEWWVFSGLSDENKKLIYLKAKEYRVREGLKTEAALEKAIEDLKELNLPMGEGDKSNADTWREKQKTKTRKENRSKRPVDEMLKDDSAFGTITEMNS
jgi:hypothetical protein